MDAETQIELELQRLKNSKQPKKDWGKGSKITRADIDNAIKNGGELIMSDNDMAMKPKTTLGFGKHANRTYEWVKQYDRQYFNWACENVQGFAAKAKAAIS
jgi:hypothetical protein